MGAGINTKPPIGLLRHTPRPRDAEEVPVGSLVRTPLGTEATVIAHRGFRRGHRIWLVCRYVTPTNKRFDVVQLLPELAVVLELPPDDETAQQAADAAKIARCTNVVPK